jgi:hypothetical protein
VALTITQVRVHWDGVAGAAGYEIRVDGVKKATTKATTRSSLVSVDDKCKLEVLDLPKKGLVQECDFEQKDGTL